MDRVVFAHAQSAAPLALQAMAAAVADGGEALPAVLALEHPEKWGEASLFCLYDVHPAALSETQLAEIPDQAAWVYSARFCFEHAASVAAWHAQSGMPGLYEVYREQFAAAPTLGEVFLPPWPISDPSPGNPVRGDAAKARICVPIMPVNDQELRRLQKEYLTCEAACYLAMLEPAEDMRELCERLYGYNLFYLPDGEGPRWNFDLSCLLHVGAIVAGAVPDCVRTFCPEASSLAEAVSCAAARNGKGIAHDAHVMAALRRAFLDTLRRVTR